MPKKQQRGVFEHPKGSSVYWINYYDAKGKRHREKVGGYRAAIDAYYERKLSIRQGKFKPPRAAGISFRDLVEESFADRQTRLSPASCSTDRARSHPLVEWFGAMSASRITAPMIADCLRELREERSGPTVNRYKALLSAIFKWGMRNGKLFDNPARDVQGYRDSEKRVRYLDEISEEPALRDAIQRDYPEFEPELDLAIHTGMRRNELYRLPWKDVDLGRGVLTVRGKAHANSQQNRIRHIPINSAAAEAFEKLYARRNGSAYVCAGFHADEAGRSPNPDERDRREWFENSIEVAGIDDFHYHDLRHTFASRLVMNGVPLAAVMEFLGHTTLNMVLRYAHLAPGHQKANIESLVKPRPVLAPVTPIRNFETEISVKDGDSRQESDEPVHKQTECQTATATTTATRKVGSM